MTKLTRPVISTVLTLALGISAFAQSQTCPPPNPGEMSAPPCSTTQLTSDDPIQGQAQTTDSTTVVTETVLTDTAIDLVVGTILSLF